MINALAVSSDENLLPLSQYLWSQKVFHRISERVHQQIVWVMDEEDVMLVQAAYKALQEGELSFVTVSEKYLSAKPEDDIELMIPQLRAVPFTSAMIFTSLLVTLSYKVFGIWELYDLFRMGTFSFIFESRQFWRLITPVFLHFDVMHIAFNMVLLWVFGRQLELQEKSPAFLILILLFAIIPNVGQSLFVGIHFGGMSGVVYGLLGYCWLYNRLSLKSVFVFPNAIMGLAVSWLVLGFTGVFDKVFSPTANIAHLGGLLAGLTCAWGIVLLRSFQKN